MRLLLADTDSHAWRRQERTPARVRTQVWPRCSRATCYSPVARPAAASVVGPPRPDRLGALVPGEGRAGASGPRANPEGPLDESGKLVRERGGLLLGEQSSHQEANELTVPSGQEHAPAVARADDCFRLWTVVHPHFRLGDAAIAPVRCACRHAGRTGLPARCAWAPALAWLPLSEWGMHLAPPMC